MPSVGFKEISVNFHVNALGIASDALPWGDAILLHGDYVTFILPDFSEIFWKGVLPIMQGFILEATRSEGRLGRQSSLFGFAVSPGATYKESETACFIANTAQEHVAELDDPKLAVHRYHMNLITDTNAALATLESPYRLAALAIDQVSGEVS